MSELDRMRAESAPTDQDMRDHIVWMAPDGKETEHLIAFNRWLREHDRRTRAEAWDEGDEARAAFTRAAYDMSVRARDAIALVPRNPYLEGDEK